MFQYNFDVSISCIFYPLSFQTISMHNQFELELRQQLTRQAGAHSDHLRDSLKQQELELKQQLARALDEQVMKQQLEFKTRLASMIGRLRGIDKALKGK